MQDYFGIFSFLSAHIHVAGWLVIVTLAWKVSSKWEAFISGIQKTQKIAEESESQLTRVREKLVLISTNHLPHLQAAIDDVNKNMQNMDENIVAELKGLRADLLQYALRNKD